MYCKNCGSRIEENVSFCPNCGSRIEINESKSDFDSYTKEETVVTPKRQARCWSVFANVGKILGIVAMCLCWVPLLIGFFIGINGIVFACLGKKSNVEGNDRKFAIGLTLSIIASIASFIFYIIYLFAFVGSFFLIQF